jgi:hypothetical protein
MKILRNIKEKGGMISEIGAMTIKNIGKMNTGILRNTEKNDAMNLRRNAKNAVENLGNAGKKLRIDERTAGSIKGMEEVDDRSTSRIYFYQ